MNHITPIPAFHDNYIWMILHPVARQAVIVDPGDAKPVINILKKQQLQLAAIFITHHHWDHTHGIMELSQFQQVPIYGPLNEPVSPCDYPLAQDDHINLQSLEFSFRVLDIPGHTQGHIAYVGLGGVFCGDTLFTGGCGRLFEGSAEQLHQSLCQLAALPPETLVYCGHEYTEKNLQFACEVEPENPALLKRLAEVQQLRSQNKPTVPAPLAEELETNPFLRCHLPTVQIAVEAQCGHKLSTPVEVFAELRKWKDIFTN